MCYIIKAIDIKNMIKINGITNQRGRERLFNKWFWDNRMKKINLILILYTEISRKCIGNMIIVQFY